ncbi:MAG: DNA polymerase III subunit chi [Burkholderiaceae bacterium]
MTRVDFHFNTPDKFIYGCRLLRKVLKTGHRAIVYSENNSELTHFDQLLWTFSPQDFIPHVMADNKLADQTPVVLTSNPSQANHHDIIVNLGATTPPDFGRFERLLELVGDNEDDRAAARNRWRFYRDRGYPIERYDQAAVKK